MTNNSRIRVAVVFGGKSGEHSISCSTAAGVLRALDPARFEVIPVGITREGSWVIAPEDPTLIEGGRAEVDETGAALALALNGADSALVVKEASEIPQRLGHVDVVFPLLHGPFGEDGTIQGLFEMADIRYVGSGVLGSAVGMDKHFMKVALIAAGLPVGPYVPVPPRRWRTDRDAVLAEISALTFPVFVKPARAGSSLGISRVERIEDVPAAIAEAQRHDPKVIVEEGIDGREVECAVLQGHGDAEPRTAPLGEIVVDPEHADFYDFESKYFDTEGVTLRCPADVPAEASEEIRALAARAFEALDCEGLARVDFFLTPDGRPIINELNTMPGFTPFSMYPVMWQAAGLSYPELVAELIQLALERPVGLR